MSTVSNTITTPAASVSVSTHSHPPCVMVYRVDVLEAGDRSRDRRKRESCSIFTTLTAAHQFAFDEAKKIYQYRCDELKIEPDEDMKQYIEDKYTIDTQSGQLKEEGDGCYRFDDHVEPGLGQSVLTSVIEFDFKKDLILRAEFEA